MFAFWDLVFRTYRTATREPHETMRLGLDELRGPEANHLLWLLRSIAWGNLPTASPAPIPPPGDRGLTPPMRP